MVCQMGKKSFIAIVLLVIFCVSALCSCDDGMYSGDECRKIVHEEFGMEQILCQIRMNSIWFVTVDGNKSKDETHPIENEFSYYYNYFLGVKDGEELAVLVPQYKSEKICLSSWIFDVPCREMMKSLREAARGELSTSNGYVYFTMLSPYERGEMLRLVPDLETIQLDVPLMLLCDFDPYAIVQSGGELLIFEIS